MFAGIVQKALYLRTDNGVYGIIRTEKHDVVFINLRKCKVQPVVGMVFVEDVVRIVLLVQKSQRQRRFGVRIDADAVCLAAIVLQKLDNHLSYAVIACFADETCFDTCSAERDDGIECRPSRHSLNGLVVTEDDIEHSLADSNYFSHFIRIFCKDTNKLRIKN